MLSSLTDEGRKTLKGRPERLQDLQMAAAVGQTRLMSRYDELFGKKGCLIGQMLLTHADFHQKIRLTNARRTVENLLRNRVIPVINENDTVATSEIRFGDNDRLAARVAQLVMADSLVLLSDVDGLYDADPRRNAGARKGLAFG